MAPYEALYGRCCPFPVGLFERREARLLGTDLVRDSLEKVKLIKDRLRTTQSRRKSYVLLRVSPMKDVMRFGKKGKLSPGYTNPFEILKRVGEVAYIFALLPSLSKVHPVFHVSMLQKYYGDLLHVLDFSSVQLDKDLTYVEESVLILDRQVQKLRSKSIALVKVHWRGQPVEEASWETEHGMQSGYPHIFGTSGMSLCMFEDERLL
ncbi:uncharacterized protein [Nicotiana tomentosiformis]|uniref:uncharacterized protein n=1 Tax=Nicotiana tomentosiformis TaxID=4098 RepID=UPI00388CA770